MSSITRCKLFPRSTIMM